MSKMNAGLLATRRVAPLPCQQPSQLAPLLLHLSFFGKSFGIILATALQRLVFSLLASGRSVVQFFVDLQRMVWRSVGWMSASPRSPALRDLGLRFTLPRWKIFSGKCSSSRSGCLMPWRCAPRAQSGPCFDSGPERGSHCFWSNMDALSMCQRACAVKQRRRGVSTQHFKGHTSRAKLRLPRRWL